MWYFHYNCFIRVCYLAGEFVKHLRQEETISEQDEYCVRLAGLCHDLGNFISTFYSKNSDNELSNQQIAFS